ncbi:MAG: phosphoribosylamine--glycine ligase [Alphaproteobacteria bacterium]|nr:phosphoribosylamine--glycine ligase [Alphaproteobacteria bacterium]MCA0450583.1 phosphoribosylamine--glycine ligase [Pseudomonadota bacterium]
MRILVVGSGGREHSLCWAISASPLCDKLFCAPGNPGIAALAECLPVGAEDIPGIVAAAKAQKIDFVVVGPEAPLVAGIVDRLAEAGIPAFGPMAVAAQLEGSKGFMKDFCARAGIPTAEYRRFTDADLARAYIREKGAPIVVKADGLAAGKGVVVAATLEEALAAIDDAMVAGRFGKAGAEVVVEEFLDGEEASFFALCDGEHALSFGAAQDHKRVGDGDTGPNTGGMGAYSPTKLVDAAMEKRIMETIVLPTVAGMAKEGAPFKGVLFAGLMIGKAGPKLIEFNVRFGDPECQTLMLRLKSDLLPALIASQQGELKRFDLRWRDDTAICVVMAAEGYPNTPKKGTEIRNLDAAGKLDGVTVFHAGTKADGAKIVADGGRVLGVCAIGKTAKDAQAKAYKAVDAIDWPGGFCRRDIGWRVL